MPAGPARRHAVSAASALYGDVIVQRWEQFTGEKAECFPAAAEVSHAEG